MQIAEVLGQIPDGSYPAIAGGYVSRFQVNGQVVEAKFDNGVRGINIKDTVTIRDGKISSLILGENGQIYSR